MTRCWSGPGVKALLGAYPRPVLLKAVRDGAGMPSGARPCGNEADRRAFAEEASDGPHFRRTGRDRCARSLKRVVNGTGVVIHTNLGRSPLPESSGRSCDAVAFGYSNLEFDLERGVRGSRYAHVERLLCELTGAEAALVVNNNAAAVLLALSAPGRRAGKSSSRGANWWRSAARSASPMSCA